VRQQETALQRRGDYGPFDLQFHRSVAECARNLPLKVLMDALSDLTVEVVAGLNLSTGTQHQVCDSHRLIADAIEQRDEEAASRLMLQHVAQIQLRLGRALARQRRTTALAGRDGLRHRPRARRPPRDG
jgi:DNA-binding FadR family transcriptional regulator